MPKLIFKKNKKFYAHKKNRKKMEFRALWSQPLFFYVFSRFFFKK